MASGGRDLSGEVTGTTSMENKIVNDPIHGNIELHPLCVKVIDTPQFQRLRNIKQLGGCYMVYPGAAHNRFEHSIGTCFLAGELARSLQRKQPDLGITDKDIRCVEIAGLCHDLGHGPFSHLFDQSFIPRKVDRKWQHEEASKKMFDHLLDSNGLKHEFRKHGLDKSGIEFVKELIDGKCSQVSGTTDKKKCLYEIVANKRNGIDVDKWDYFARDCHGLGIRNNFDHGRMISFARVIEVNNEWQICYKKKEATNLFEMFHTRMTLHRRAYQHRVNKVIEEMITDALVKADDHITFIGEDGKLKRMSEAIDDMEAYSKLTDCVLQQILVSDKPELETSQRILERIQKRDLYKFVGEFRPSSDEKFVKSDILRELGAILQKQGFSTPQVTDLYVQIINLNYGKGNENPIDDVCFYTKKNPFQAKRLSEEEVSMMLPRKYSEQIVRLFCKKNDDSIRRNAKTCLVKWCKEMGKEPELADQAEGTSAD